jgi:hypothetical protein
MKRTAALAGAMVLMAGMCAAQVALSNRAEFGKECGIQDTSAESAFGFVRSGEGEWRVG